MTAPTPAPAPVSAIAVVTAHVAWLRLRHSQSAGAARNLRRAAVEETNQVLVHSKRQAADNAAVNAAHYYELAEMLEAVMRARKQLRDSELSTFAPNAGSRAAFIQAVDRVLGGGR